MEEKDLFKKIKKESGDNVPDVYKKVVSEAEARGLLNVDGGTAEVYSDGETVAAGGVSRKAIAITALVGVAGISLAIALPLAFVKTGGMPLADKPFGESYAVGTVAAAKLAESFFGEENEDGGAAGDRIGKTASLVVDPGEYGIERYISEFDNYYYACNSFFGAKPADVEVVENHDVKYDNSIIINGKFSNGDVARYAMYYSEARVTGDTTVKGDEVKYYLEGILCLNDKDYSIVGERIYADSTKENEKSLALKAYPINHDANNRVEMCVQYAADGTVEKYGFTVVKGDKTLSESVLTFPDGKVGEDPAYRIEFNGDDGERVGQFTVNRPQAGWESLKIGYEIGNLKSEFRVKATASKLERVLAPDGLIYTDLGDGTYSISGYDKNKKLPAELILPTEFDGKKIVKIGGSALSKCPDIKRLVVPEGVTVIGDYAFYMCANLTDVVFPQSLTEIKACAFSYTAISAINLPDNLITLRNQVFMSCNNLVSVALPEKLETVGDELFLLSENLKSVSIPASLNTIGKGIFSGTSLDNIYVDPANATFYEQGGCLLDRATKSVMGGKVGFTVPEDATAIGKYAFYCCKHLTNLVLPASVTLVDSLAFNNSSIENIVLTGVEKIEFAAFSDSSVKNIEFSEKLTAMDSNALTDCHNLTSLNLPASLTSIGMNVFGGCYSLESIAVAEGNTIYHSAGNCLIETNSGTVVLGCKKSEIPDDGSVVCVGNSAFACLPNLTQINLPDGLLIIGDSAFIGCTSLKNITLPESLLIIEPYAFQDSGLESITIPDGVAVDAVAFAGCQSLSEVILSDGVTVKNDTFFNCISLKKLVFPGSVTAIPENVCQYCQELESVTIASTVTEIGGQAFYGCYTLTEINFGGTMEEWNNMPKGDGWDWDTGEYAVKCSDGTLDKQGNLV